MTYKQTYIKNFDLIEADFIVCEFSFIRFGAMIEATDIHHLTYKSQGGKDDINNLMAVSRKVHDAIHQEQHSKEDLMNIHLEFLNNNPY